jgi:hypothetical protein
MPGGGGLRRAGLAGGIERRACESSGSFLRERERSGTRNVLEGRGVGEVGVRVRGLMEAGLSLRG